MPARRGAVLATLLCASAVLFSGAPARADGQRYLVRTADPLAREGLSVRYDWGKDGFVAPLGAADLTRFKIARIPVSPVASRRAGVGEVQGKPDGSGGGKGGGGSGGGGSGGGGKGGKGGGKGGGSVPDPVPWGVERVVLGTASGNDALPSPATAGRGVTVAVVDTGIDTDHPDLVTSVSLTPKRCANFVGLVGCEDDNGHGTHVAGIIGADGTDPVAPLWGVAPGADLMILKACDAAGVCSTDDIAAAIRFAADNGANIVNLSIGGSVSYLEETLAIDYAGSKGVLVVGAAGNLSAGETFCARVKYPAAYTGVVSVAATDITDAVPDLSCRGYNDGDGVREEGELDVGAPGAAVESAARGGGRETRSGTSMAAAHISAVAALMWEQQGGATGVRRWLDEQGDDIVRGTWAGVGEDRASGWGLPDVP